VPAFVGLEASVRKPHSGKVAQCLLTYAHGCTKAMPSLLTDKLPTKLIHSTPPWSPIVPGRALTWLNDAPRDLIDCTLTTASIILLSDPGFPPYASLPLVLKRLGLRLKLYHLIIPRGAQSKIFLVLLSSIIRTSHCDISETQLKRRSSYRPHRYP
jgi:hypothetical protein